MQFQSLNSPPHDDRSIPWDSVVLPLGTPGGGVHKGVPMSPCISVWTSWPQLGGLFHNLFIAGILGEAQTCVCSLSSSWDSSDLKGQL